MTCLLKHIPEHLRTNEKPTEHTFKVGGELYRRSSEKELDNPFASISIVDVSVNRGELNGKKISEEKDVLLNIRSNDPEAYDQNVCLLKIKDLKEDNTYNKMFEQEKGGIMIKANFILSHVPEPCMYPHCAFRVFLDGIEINDFQLYKDTIGKLNKIRTALKQDLATMIVQREVSQSKRPN